MLNALEYMYQDRPRSGPYILYVVIKDNQNESTHHSATKLGRQLEIKVKKIRLPRFARGRMCSAFIELVRCRAEIRRSTAHHPDKDVLLGNSTSSGLMIAAWLCQPARITVLDDGNSTQSAFEDIASRHGGDASWYRSKGERGPGGWRTASYAALRRISGVVENEVTWFTRYVDSAKHANVKYRENYISYTRQLVSSKERSKGQPAWTAILGQPLVERGGVTFDTYIRGVRLACRESVGVAIYIPHWRESPQFVERLRSAVDIETRTYKLPFEIAYVESKEPPARVVSFFSSAIENLIGMGFCDTQYEALRIPIEEIKQVQMRQYAQDAYQRFERNPNIRVRDLAYRSDDC